MPHVLRGSLLAGALLLLAGCGFGSSAPRETAPKEKVTRAQLAAMVLPKAKLGPSVQGLRLNAGSGLMTNAKYASATIDPDDSAGSLKSGGRVLGYDQTYESPQLAARKVRGTHTVSTGVELLRDRVYATQYLHARLNDNDRLQGTVVPGVKLRNVSAFEVAGIGEEGGGTRGTFVVSGLFTGHETVVAFRRGRIVGYVTIMRGTKSDARQEAMRLAVALDRRIQDVLAGEIAVKPQEPKVPDRALVAARKKLPEMTMAAEDVGGGARVFQEGRGRGDGYTSYRRSFQDVLVGSSHLLALNAETQLHESVSGAELTMKLLGTSAGRQIFSKSLVEGFAEETGMRPMNIRVKPMQDPGPGMKGIVVTFELLGAKFTTASIFMRDGGVVQAVSGTCRREAFDPNDLKPLARRVQTRLTAV
ncbi:MAG: hypothetical protein ACRDM2_07530 [Gaiellaceae bacterium]